MNLAEQIKKKLEEIATATGDKNVWRKEITLKVRADNLYWWMFLAEIGIYAKKKFKSLWGRKKTGHDAAERAASLASWEMDMERIGKQVLTQLSAQFPVVPAGEKAVEDYAQGR